MSLSPPPPPPTLLMTQDVPSNGVVGSVGNGSYVPVIVVLVVIAVLTAASVAVGQLCVWRRAFLNDGYNMEAFVERKCGMCISGGPMKKGCDIEGAAMEEDA